MKENTTNNQPVYPAGMEERLAKYKAAFLEKVKKWKWDEPEVSTSKPRGRKAKVTKRIESKPRTKSEQGAFAYNWVK